MLPKELGIPDLWNRALLFSDINENGVACF